MSAIQCMSTASDKGFQNRVKYYMQKAASAIIGEVGTTDGHTERVAYAQTILNGSASILEMAIAVTTDSTIAAAIEAETAYTDANIETAVNSLINDFAGYDA